MTSLPPVKTPGDMSALESGDFDIKEKIWIDCTTQDELAAPTKPPRITPRNSLGSIPSPTSLNPTPHAALRHPAAVIGKSSTPRRERSSIGATMLQHHVATNNVNRLRTPSARQPLQPTLANRSNPTTPHAIRAMQQRRATPGRDRRKSGRLQRETPRDILRNLGKLLAPTSQVIEPSPLLLQPTPRKPEHAYDDELEENQDLSEPRFSIAIDDETEEDDSFQEAPPGLSMPLEDGDQTGGSFEIARRATNEERLGRVSRGSFGSLQTTDRFGNISELAYDDASHLRGDDSTVQSGLDDDADELGSRDKQSDPGGNTDGLRRAMLKDSGRQSNHFGPRQQARQLDAGALSPFVLRVPRFAPAHDSPLGTSLDEQPFHDDDDPLEIGDQDEPDEFLNDSCLHKPESWAKVRERQPKALSRSRHGISYPSLPCGVTKKIALTCSRVMGMKKSNISKESLKAIMDASDRYFEQVSEDLGVLAHHAGRKKIEEGDVIAVMKRQRKVSATSTPFSLAQKYLPREQLQDIRMPLPRTRLGQRRRRLEAIEEHDNDNDL